MESLKELTDYLKTVKENGASFSDLKDIFKDEAEIRNFIKIGLENTVIIKTGEKRGTRYYSSNFTPNEKVIESQPANKKQEKKNLKESEDYESNYEKGKELDFYLQSDKPVVGIPVITKTTFFGDCKNLLHFLQAGIIVKQYYLEYDKKIKKNIIVQEIENKIYNRVAIRRDGRTFFLDEVNVQNATTKRNEFKNYELFREYIRAEFVV